MSRAQWGHGYYTGKKDAESEACGYVGLFFLSLKGGRLYQQGQLDKEVDEGRFVATLFSWLDGTPNTQRIVELDQRKDEQTFLLFSDDYLWRKTAAKIMADQAVKDYGEGSDAAKNAANLYRNFDAYVARIRRLFS